MKLHVNSFAIDVQSDGALEGGYGISESTHFRVVAGLGRSASGPVHVRLAVGLARDEPKTPVGKVFVLWPTK